MKAVAIQSSPNPVHTTSYNQFRGVDMTTDSAKIDNSRSPYAPNLIVDSGGFPEKRLGYRTLVTLEQPINGLFYTFLKDKPLFLAHGGTKLYRWRENDTPIVLKDGLNNAKSAGFAMKGMFWLLTGREYLAYDGETVKEVSELAFVPTTTIARAPTGGGKAYDTVNMLQPKRKNSFLADGTKLYQLDTTDLDDSPVTATVDGVEQAETTHFTVDRKKGLVTFVTAPPAPTTQVGKDNVTISFAKTVEGYADRIKQCAIATTYGVGTNDRVFLTGNPKYQSTDWHSELNDPSYIPDLSYSLIGSENTAIMGYSKIGEYLAVIKEDDGQDSTIFLRSARLDRIDADTTEAVFPLKQGVTGVGAVSRYAIGKLSDEPLFLSRNGIYALTSNLITAERTVQNRSWFVNPVLIKEENLENAVCTEWNGLFIVCINTRCYILDGKQNKSYKPQSNSEFVYECYHWTDIPAVCFLEHQGHLYFGTAKGEICRFNDDDPFVTRYNDNGKAIICSWSTWADDDGDFMRRKTIPRNGSGLMLKPYTRSSCKITIRTDGDFGVDIKKAYMDLFNFEDIDLERLSFNTNDRPQVIPFGKKIRKYITAQIIVSNDTVNEGFGVLGIIKRYTMGNYVKR